MQKLSKNEITELDKGMLPYRMEGESLIILIDYEDSTDRSTIELTKDDSGLFAGFEDRKANDVYEVIHSESFSYSRLYAFYQSIYEEVSF
ncbi:hypothetical protein [Halobacillus campisalis]|uniref:DUF1292 domain-containing protein n=1 Tax=Halobacillus campisalis TaxID=435909 RepID=A0ABW2K4L0_9BACI|nr:hypothetical protein [Halobacillus campisalis]